MVLGLFATTGCGSSASASREPSVEMVGSGYQATLPSGWVKKMPTLPTEDSLYFGPDGQESLSVNIVPTSESVQSVMQTFEASCADTPVSAQTSLGGVRGSNAHCHTGDSSSGVRGFTEIASVERNTSTYEILFTASLQSNSAPDDSPFKDVVATWVWR
jgi:hypothetical protein